MPLNLIPQVFYDFIARVIPGFVVIATWYLAILGPNKAIDTIITISSKSDQSLFNFWSFSVVIILSYVLGFVLDELQSLTFGRIKKKNQRRTELRYIRSCITHDGKIRKCFGESALEIKSRDLPSFHIVLDHLRLQSQSEAYRLLKLRAEAQLCDVLFTGLSPLLVVNILFWYRDSQLLMLDRIVLELVLIGAMIAFWRASDRFQKFYITGTLTSWLFSSFPIGPLERTGVPQRPMDDVVDV